MAVQTAKSPQTAAVQRSEDFGLLVSALSLLVNDQLRVFAVFLIGADQQKIHICGNAEAAVAAKLTFQLVAEVGCLIVKEFDSFSVGKAVCKVDILAYKRVELFHLGHPVNMQIVEFIHQRLLVFLKRLRAAEIFIPLPVIELWQRILQ